MQRLAKCRSRSLVDGIPLVSAWPSLHGSVLYWEGSDSASVLAIDGLYYATKLWSPTHCTKRWSQPLGQWNILQSWFSSWVSPALSWHCHIWYQKDFTLFSNRDLYRHTFMCWLVTGLLIWLNLWINFWCPCNRFLALLYWGRGGIGRKKQKSVSVASERALHAGWPMTDEHCTGIFLSKSPARLYIFYPWNDYHQCYFPHDLFTPRWQIRR